MNASPSARASLRFSVTGVVLQGERSPRGISSNGEQQRGHPRIAARLARTPNGTTRTPNESAAPPSAISAFRRLARRVWCAQRTAPTGLRSGLEWRASTLTTQHRFDLANRLIGITYPSGLVASYTRDAQGRVSERKLGHPLFPSVSLWASRRPNRPFRSDRNSREEPTRPGASGA
jgi:YD repeat-containing protein